MPVGTAWARLRKIVLFDILKRHNENICYQCGKVIESVEVLSIEHKKPWQNENPKLFWSLDNIAFSHLSCNVANARRRKANHGSVRKYEQGCRCIKCKKARYVKHKKALEKKRK